MQGPITTAESGSFLIGSRWFLMYPELTSIPGGEAENSECRSMLNWFQGPNRNTTNCLVKCVSAPRDAMNYMSV